ncbi:unnamed protein product [Cochlearia groenlandica]
MEKWKERQQQIPDGLSETQIRCDVLLQLTLVNENCKNPSRDCLAKLIASESKTEESKKKKMTCLIDDSGWVFTQSVAQSFNLSRFVLCTYKFTFFLGHLLLPQLRRQGFLPVSDSEAEDIVPLFPPLRKKDLSRIMGTKAQGEPLDAYLLKIHETTKLASGLIVMSCLELDQDSLAESNKVFTFPIYPIAPFHIYNDVPASSSSLFEPDQSCISWLDKRETNYVESLPLEFMESLEGKGKIVKWAPQQNVLAHRATGGFLTHNGWNSTLESICVGVPMICLPLVWDQWLNARSVSEVWRIGIHLEGCIERGDIERAVRRLMVEPEGEEIGERIKELQYEVIRSVKPGGSSYRSLDNLVGHILSL